MLRRNRQANSPSLSQYYPILENYIQECRASGEVFTEQEKTRFALLQTACSSNDYFYIAFHQVLCLWFADRDFLKDTVAQPGQNDKILDRGMCHMTQFLIAQKAAPVAAKHGKWFTTFPIDFHHLRNYSDAYRTAVNDVAASLILITQHVNAFLSQCVQRRYPPLADEIIRIFRVSSPIVQRLMFTWVRKTMGIRTDNFADAMLQEFQQSQSLNAQLSARINTNMPPTQRELEDATNYTVNQYLRIRTEQEAHLRVTGSLQPLATNVPQPSAQSPIPQSTIQQSPIMGGGQQYPQRTSSGAVQHHAQGMASPGPQSPAPQSPRILQQQLVQAQTQAQGQALRRPSSVASPHSGAGIVPITNRSPMNLASPQVAPMQSPTMRGNQFVVPASANQSHHGSFSVASSHIVPSNGMPSPQSHPQQQHQQFHQGQGQMMPQGSYPPQYRYGPLSTAQQVHLLRQSTGVQPTRPQNTTRRTGRLLYPAEGEPAPAPHLPNPDMTALHMLDRRSPTLKPVDRQEENKGKPADRYYQVVRRYLVGPSVLEARFVDTFEFRLEDADIDNFPKSKSIRPTDPDLREVKHGSLMYRVRCVKLPDKRKEITEEEFVVADTAWPAHITIEGKDADGNPVTVTDLRRKTQFGKDLPVDITKLVTRFFADKKDIPLSLNVALSRPHSKSARYAFAVEEVEVVRHDIISSSILEAKIDFKTTEEGIKRLLSSQTDDDDDIIMDPSELTIGLQDPWLAKMWKVPVKGAHCRHRECFDLDLWLETRPETRREKSVVHYAHDNDGAFISGVDVWKCPLCGEDARPEKLRVDEWMQSVREKLVADGVAEEARAIVVAPDGSWKMKEEKEVAQNNVSAVKEEAKEEEETRKAKESVEVIDLDSD